METPIQDPEAVGQQETRKLYAEHLADSNLSKPRAIGNCLLDLAEVFDRTLTAPMVKVYISALNHLTPYELIQAFTRATLELRFFPVPAVLLDLSGRPKPGGARRGLRELTIIFSYMRNGHGPTLAPILGPVLSTRGPNGEYLKPSEYPRGATIESPKFAPAIEDAIEDCGLGNRQAGLSFLASHPSLPWNLSGESDWKRRDAEKIEERWCDAFEQSLGPAVGRS